MKVVLSQTIFADVATLPEGSPSGAVIPRLPILKEGEYPENDRPVSDMDSNGWPRSGRDRALCAMRKGFAVHIAGDQHLGSTVQYGVEDFGDAAFALCVPSISNFWPRRWYPAEPGRNRAPGAPRYTGEFEDGFGNKITVHAVSNPRFTGKKPARLYDRAAGYGIARFRRADRSVVFENWPRETDPAQPGAKPYPGWPVRFRQIDNYGREPLAFLPEIRVEGMTDPVVQVWEERSGELVYALRISGRAFRPMIFRDGSYLVRIGDPDPGLWRELSGLAPLKEGEEEHLQVDF
jgi:hypothetical protein